jgi:hypothetical protein
MPARHGTIWRLSRGVYRLVAYPSNEETVQQWEAFLWPTTRRDARPGHALASDGAAAGFSEGRRGKDATRHREQVRGVGYGKASSVV